MKNSERLPNILIIFTDEQRADTLSCMGNTFCDTPNIDQLAKDGVLFRNAFTTAPLCVPARANLLTGRPIFHTGVWTNGWPIPPGFITFPQYLTYAGYLTAAIGKMHFNPPRTPYGLQIFKMMEEVPRPLNIDDYWQYLNKNGYGALDYPHGIRGEYYWRPQKSVLPKEHFDTTWVGNEAVKFIHEHRNETFMLWVSFIKPHPPVELPYDYKNPISYKDIPLPEIPHEKDREFYLEKIMEKASKPFLDKENLQRIIGDYWANIMLIDEQVGRIIDTLKRLDIYDNTFIVYTSDHGDMLGDHGLLNKHLYYEEAIRIPMIIKDIGKDSKKKVENRFVILEDLYPTFLELAHLPIPQGLSGNSLIPLLRTDKIEWRDEVYGVIHSDPRYQFFMVRTSKYKYIYSPLGQEQLFNIEEDPKERKNLAKDNKYKKIKEELEQRIVEWFYQRGFEVPIENGKLKRYELKELPSEEDWLYPPAKLPDRNAQPLLFNNRKH